VNNYRFIAIIPARYDSARFPGKPLADLGGKPVIQRVYEQVAKAVPHVFVATDDPRIQAAVFDFGGQVIMTSRTCRSGTERCAEACLALHDNHSIIINVQGDEPFIQPEQIRQLKRCFRDSSVRIASLALPCPRSHHDLRSPNTVKVVFNNQREALYFSRALIPARTTNNPSQPNAQTVYKHIGIYAYRSNVLQAISRLPPSHLERSESLEQLRWLDNGYKIKIALTRHPTLSINSPNDLRHARTLLHSQP